jgi:hypothetical protein
MSYCAMHGMPEDAHVQLVAATFLSAAHAHFGFMIEADMVVQSL